MTKSYVSNNHRPSTGGRLKEVLAALPSEATYARERLRLIEKQGGIKPSTDQRCFLDWELVSQIAVEGLGLSPDEVERARHVLAVAEQDPAVVSILKARGGNHAR